MSCAALDKIAWAGFVQAGWAQGKLTWVALHGAVALFVRIAHLVRLEVRRVAPAQLTHVVEVCMPVSEHDPASACVVMRVRMARGVLRGVRLRAGLSPAASA